MTETATPRRPGAVGDVSKNSNLLQLFVEAGSVTTTAHTKAQAQAAGDFIVFQALVRLHLPTILDQADDTEGQIRLPAEFVLLDLETE